MSFRSGNILERINTIEEEDLQYIEIDLCFYQVVSLSFLLYGDNKPASEFILQRILILSQHPPQGKGDFGSTNDFLRSYAKLNPEHWRLHIVEALAIIRAKRVLRKLGFSWQEIYQHFLPTVAEISVHIHPLLKALYKISERLTPDQACRLIAYVHERHNNCKDLRFYDSLYLEVFFLNWLTKRVIDIGNKQMENCDLEILIEYLKFNEMDAINDVLRETIRQQLNCEEKPKVVAQAEDHGLLNNVTANDPSETFKDSGISVISVSTPLALDKVTEPANVHDYAEVENFDGAERYKITREQAGYVLIINQNTFYEETNPELQHLLPKPTFKPTRNGTDVDRDKLMNLFSPYGYIPLVYDNLTHWEILHHIRETVKKSLLKDSIIICLLTHGKEGAVYGCNCIPVSLTDIKEILTDDTLKRKPKLLLVQACQKDDPKVDTTSSKAIQTFSPDAYADILLAVSAMKGTESLRDPKTGSWYVESICKIINKYGNRKHLLDILTAVVNDISNKKTEYEDDVMLPEIITTLRKDFYLPRI